MKNDRVFLCEWMGDVTDGYNDIPWPMVHEWVGHDTIRWLNQQRHLDCQLMLEKSTDSFKGFMKLYAEFYNPAIRTEFAIRFAK